MNASRRPIRLAAAVLAMVLAPPLTAQETSDGATYTSGGVGAESREALLEQQANYSLKLVFAYTTGAFLAEVAVTITDTAGNQVLSAVSRGPWFLARLPAGEYRVTAAAQGTAQTATLQVPETGLVEHVMRWQPPAGPDMEPAAESAVEPVAHPGTEPAPEPAATQELLPSETSVPGGEPEPAPAPAPAAPAPSDEGLAPVEDRSPPPDGSLAPVEER
jgi:hypothetical protein